MNLKEMRKQSQDPMLTELLQAYDTALEEAGYRPGTRKPYKWQAKTFFEWCGKHNIQPKAATEKDLGKYLGEINIAVEKKKKSWSNFLQACASLEILYHLVIHDVERARYIPKFRKKITS
jgi:hypothetical protein